MFPLSCTSGWRQSSLRLFCNTLIRLSPFPFWKPLVFGFRFCKGKGNGSSLQGRCFLAFSSRLRLLSGFQILQAYSRQCPRQYLSWSGICFCPRFWFYFVIVSFSFLCCLSYFLELEFVFVSYFVELGVQEFHSLEKYFTVLDSGARLFGLFYVRHLLARFFCLNLLIILLWWFTN